MPAQQCNQLWQCLEEGCQKTKLGQLECDACIMHWFDRFYDTTEVKEMEEGV